MVVTFKLKAIGNSTPEMICPFSIQKIEYSRPILPRPQTNGEDPISIYRFPSGKRCKILQQYESLSVFFYFVMTLH